MADAPHYSPVASGGGLLFVSGQLPALADGAPADADFEGQVRSALGKLLAVLDSAGAAAVDVVKVTAYIVGVERWAAFNAIYADVFGAAKPARTVVPVAELHYGALVEIDAVAMQANTQDGP